MCHCLSNKLQWVIAWPIIFSESLSKLLNLHGSIASILSSVIFVLFYPFFAIFLSNLKYCKHFFRSQSLLGLFYFFLFFLLTCIYCTRIIFLKQFLISSIVLTSNAVYASKSSGISYICTRTWDSDPQRTRLPGLGGWDRPGPAGPPVGPSPPYTTHPPLIDWLKNLIEDLKMWRKGFSEPQTTSERERLSSSVVKI